MPTTRTVPDSDRLTVTLASGQRQVLKSIAKANDTTLAFVVRHAIRKLVEESKRGHLNMTVPVRSGRN
jgi:precorrin-4 methylase